jgi:hypothetical protein
MNERLSPFLQVKRQLVDRAVSPMVQSAPPEIVADNESRQRSLADFSTPWVSPDHFDNTAFYSDPITVMFIDNPIRHTEKKSAFEEDSWMCDNIPMSNDWQKRFLRMAPKGAFQCSPPKSAPNGSKVFMVWEWVSHLAFLSGQHSWDDYVAGHLSRAV